MSYLPNTTFETDTTGWSTDAGVTIARQTTTAFVGTASANVTTAAGASTGVLSSTSVAPPQTSSWQLTGMVQAHAGGDIGKRVYASINSVGGTAESFSGTIVTLGTGWQPVSVSVTFANASHTALLALFRAQDTGPFNFDLDFVTLARKLHYLPALSPVVSQLWTPGVPAADYFEPTDTQVTTLIATGLYAAT